jgi:hypothetical protein
LSRAGEYPRPSTNSLLSFGFEQESADQVPRGGLLRPSPAPRQQSAKYRSTIVIAARFSPSGWYNLASAFGAT